MRLTSKFLLSATSPEQFPPAAAPEFAFLGRSNTGKSSLINGLLGERAAKVSSTPGRTRAINFFALFESPSARAPRMLFADLPGYGYAKLSKSISAGWPGFINPYLAGRPNLTLCICLIDSNIPAQPSDRQLIDSLKGMGREFLVVGTKADRLSGNQRARALAHLKRDLELDALLLCSAKTGLGLSELWNRLLSLGKNTLDSGSLGYANAENAPLPRAISTRAETSPNRKLPIGAARNAPASSGFKRAQRSNRRERPK